MLLHIVMIAALLRGGDSCFSSLGGDDTLSSSNTFVNAVSLDVDPNDNVYVVDAGANEIWKFSSDGTLRQRVGGYGWSSVAFDQPRCVASPNGVDVFVADYGNHRIQRFDRNLNFVSTLYVRENDDPDRRFGYPQGVAVDRFGALFIIDGENSRMVKVSSSNAIERVFGGIDAGEGRLFNPSRVRVTSDDLVCVQDGNKIVAYDLFGNYVRTIGEGLFSSLKCYSVNNETILATDSCRFFTFTERGTRVAVAPINEEAISNCSDIIDIAIRDSLALILTKNRLLRIPLTELFSTK